MDETRVSKLENRVAELEQQISVLLVKMEQKLEDTQIRVKDIQDVIHDVKIRVHDTQDRAYDVLHNQKKMLGNNFKVSKSLISFNMDTEKNLQKNIKIERQLDELIKLENAHDEHYKRLLWEIMNHGEKMIDTKIRFFSNMEPASGQLRDMQLTGIILLENLDKICREYNISYWLSFGSLLGAIRHKGFIPWDDDTDVCMMRKDVEKLISIVEKNQDFYVARRFYVFDDNLNRCVQFKFRKFNIPCCLDIFIYDYCDDISKENVEKQLELNKFMAKDAQIIRNTDISEEEKQKKYLDLWEKYFEKSKQIVDVKNNGDCMIWAIDNMICPPSFQSNCPIEEIFPLEEVIFENHYYMAPKNPEKYLQKKYKDIYSLPNDIFSHSHFILKDQAQKDIKQILKFFGKD